MFLIGVFTGLVAAFIDITIKELSNIKYTYIKHCILILKKKSQKIGQHFPTIKLKYKKKLWPPDWPQLRPPAGPETEVFFSLAPKQHNGRMVNPT